MTTFAEIVLPSGRFASIRKITTGDIASAFQSNTGLYAMSVLMQLTATLDGVPLTLQQVLTMEYEETLPVFRNLTKQIERATKTMEGIA